MEPRISGTINSLFAASHPQRNCEACLNMEYLLQVPSLMQQKLGPKVIIPRPSLAPVFRQAITARLEKIQKGRLVLRYPDGRVQSFGSALGPSVEMSITSDNFWSRVVLLGGLVSVTPIIPRNTFMGCKSGNH